MQKGLVIVKASEISEVVYRVLPTNEYYYDWLARMAPEAMSLHKQSGLWDPADFAGNITAHCLTVASRVRMILKLLGYDATIQKLGVIAGILHDHAKMIEVRMAKAEGRSWVTYEKAGAVSEQLMVEAGFDSTVVRIATFCGHLSLKATRELLKKQEFDEIDICCLALHYADDYTNSNDQILPAENGINAFDLRMNGLKNNERYAQLNNEGIPHFGKPIFDEQAEVGYVVEALLAGLVSKKTGQSISPKNLPEFVEEKINEEILEMAA